MKKVGIGLMVYQIISGESIRVGSITEKLSGNEKEI
jgi:hypothetical protein